MAIASLVWASTALAEVATFDVLFDLDWSEASGCVVSTADGPSSTRLQTAGRVDLDRPGSGMSARSARPAAVSCDHAYPRAMLEFFYDVGSPWTYLAFHKIEEVAAEAGVPVTWKPILVGGVFNAVNPGLYEVRANASKLRWAHMGKDLADWAR